MKNVYLWAVVAVLILIMGAILYGQKGSTAAVPASETTLGTYQYECDEHVTFAITPASDMSIIKVEATKGGTYPPASTLVNQNATSGARFTGNGLVFTAHGETVTLGEGDSAINCSPVPDSNNAPFNFGD